MSLSCSCSDVDGCDWYFAIPSDFSKLETKRSRKCCSCGAKIKHGDDSLVFPRWRNPTNDIEDRIYGECGEIPLASWHMCEECGGVYLSVTELGMCFDLDGNIKDQVREMNLSGGLR